MSVRLGLKANVAQFTLLAVNNVFVGMLIGSERTVVPLLGIQDFGVSSIAILLTFVVGFGIVKGPLNLLAGHLADRVGRRNVLLAGWLLGLPVPWLLLWAPSWGLVVFANLLLGANQGLAWSMTVTSKIDIVGRAQRGLALGINEFSGYLGVALASTITGVLAAAYGLRPTPFIFAASVAVAGFVSALFVRETLPFVRHEQLQTQAAAPSESSRFLDIFADVTWRHAALRACCQAGALNKFSDTAIWVLVPLAMAAQRFGVYQIGVVSGLYAFVWGIAQLFTGALSDRVGRKVLIVGGLVLNAVGLSLAAVAHSFSGWLFAAATAGLGTALLYPVLLAAVSDVTSPARRGASLGVYRFWRDGGYALGGITIGIAAAHLNIQGSFLTLSTMLILSAVLVIWLMRETHVRTAATAPVKGVASS